MKVGNGECRKSDKSTVAVLLPSEEHIWPVRPGNCEKITIVKNHLYNFVDIQNKGPSLNWFGMLINIIYANV